MGFFDRISQGLQRSRDKFKEEMNVLLDRGPDLDEEFWDGLEETLILADIGGAAACDIVENLRDQATRKALPDAYAVLDMLNDQIADTFTEGGQEILGGDPACVLFVGINGTGKTTAAAKLANLLRGQGHAPLLAACDVYRPAAADQLETLGNELGVKVYRGDGQHPVQIAKEAIRAAVDGMKDVVIVDTAGRLQIDEA
ncbi:signal recognition particle receptor subunit alpha, partial [Senegalimassilia anaerobia]|uniref:signal recognition particle receptor subunit alpha n=1 Tax=Senegalimassilia anaerobia TaxID=1473216 RepID=UPI003A9116C9